MVILVRNVITKINIVYLLNYPDNIWIAIIRNLKLSKVKVALNGTFFSVCGFSNL